MPSDSREGILEKFDLAAAGWWRWPSKLASHGKELQLPVMLELLPCSARAPVLLCDSLPASLRTQAWIAGSEPVAVGKEFSGTLLI